MTSAQWIWLGDGAAPNTWMRFRKSVSLPSPPRSAIARIAVDSKYWLWVNGDLVVREGGLKRGPTPTGTYRDVVDIAPLLTAGENTIALLVWYFGADGSSHLSSGSGGLCFDADIDGAPLVSDGSWQAMREEAFRPSLIKPIRPGTPILSEWDVHYDARLVGRGDWADAEIHGAPPSAPWGELVDRPIPFWKDSDLLQYENASEIGLPRVSDGTPIEGRLPANIQVYPYFKIRAAEGQTIEVAPERDWKTTVYTTRDGVQEFEVPAWGNGHFVTYRFPAGVEVLDLAYRETSYDTSVAGAFECDDEALNTLWRKSWRTTLVCMRDGYMDCPDRERSQWPNDAVNMIDQTFYAFDRKSDLMTRKLFAELAGWRTETGILWGAVPCGRFRGAYRELYCISLSVLAAGVEEYYAQTGDLDGLRELARHIPAYLLDHYEVDDTILLHPRSGWATEWGPGTSNWHDWGDQANLDYRLLENVWYAYALRTARDLAAAFGDDGAAARLAERLAVYAEHFDRIFWRGGHYASLDYDGRPDDRGNALAVVAGVARPERWSSIAGVLTDERHASIYMEKYVIDALCLIGRTGDALKRAKERLEHAIASPCTTLPEEFGLDSNHGWAGWPLYILSKYVAGIAPTAPGYARYRVAPSLGALNRLRCTVPSVRGPIGLNIARDCGVWTMTLESPKGTTARVGVPKAFGERIDVPAERIGYAGEDDAYIWLEVPAGEWRFTAR